MYDRFKVLNWLSAILFVLAWAALAWSLFSLLVTPIADQYEAGYLARKGVGFMGMMAIIVDGGMRFLMLMGTSQGIKLLLHLEQAIDGLARRLADITVATTDLKAGVASTNANVLKVGSIVYEGAKKAD